VAPGLKADAPDHASLHRELDAPRLAMLALGGAIGTGLFLGSGISVRLAGPGIVLTYAIGAFTTWLLMRALAEMTVAHPQAASFGVIAEAYVHPLAGWLVRYSYWFMQPVAIGGQVTAAGIYMRFWMPGVPAWIWAAVFSAGILYVNLRGVGRLGTFEYWFSILKVIAIALFIVLGLSIVFGVGFEPVGFSNLTAHGGLLPNGLAGVWLATSLAIFSFIGAEIVAVAAGESRDPATAIPRALRMTVGYLAAVYVVASLLLVTLSPWTSAGLGESPFVTVLRTANVAAATTVTNLVVLSAALSSAVANLYVGSRMLYSLARTGFAPLPLAAVDRRGVPVRAVLSAVPILAGATAANLLSPDRAYGYLLATVTGIGFFIWIMIFATHLAFRRSWAESGRPLPYLLRGHPWGTLAGLALMFGILGATWFVEALWIAIPAGALWLGAMTAAFFAWRRAHAG
jgi:L-asparagine transporter-like permease